MSSESRIGELAGEAGAERQASAAAAVIADPGALGLAGFAATTMVLSCHGGGGLVRVGSGRHPGATMLAPWLTGRLVALVDRTEAARQTSGPTSPDATS